MKKRLGFGISVAMVALFFAQETNAQRWNSFHSDTGFSVRYPDNWFPKGISKDRLMILSSRGGAEGVIIKRGQAVISVVQEGNTESTLAQVIDRFIQDTNIVSRRTIRNQNAGSRGCRDLQEILSRGNALPTEDVPKPAPVIINTEYFCEVNRRKFVTVLRNFEGDKRQEIYQQIALRVAESLRVDE